MEKQAAQYFVLHQVALARFRSELGDDEGCFFDVVSVDDLLAQAKALQPPVLRSSRLSTSLSRLESTLSHINDFAAVVALYSGAGPKAAGLVWGSVRLMLTLASPAVGRLEEVLKMLDDISLSLPRFRVYEETLPMTPGLESALLDVYTEMTCFCARTIKFFRSTPHRFLLTSRWPEFNGDFKQTVRRLERLSQIVDGEAAAARLQTGVNKNTELLEAMEILAESNVHKDTLPCHCIPYQSNRHFFGREALLKKIRESLRQAEGTGLKSLVLHGLGGVGKTRLALQYANSSRAQFDAIFWIAADTIIKLRQSFLEVSRRLCLTLDDRDSQDAVVAVSKVKAWLDETRYRWLLVFDNVDDPEILSGVWPGDNSGSVLLTSRDSMVGFGSAASVCRVEPYDDDIGVSALLKLTGRDCEASSDQVSATKIVQALGGLPLAINQISGFIVQQKIALEDFLPFYERNAAKINARKLPSGDYEHTLSNVWEFAVARLSESSSTLQKILAFFDPDQIHESVLLEGAKESNSQELDFLRAEMDFLDAKEPLFRAALLDRKGGERTLAVHRLVQAAVIVELTAEDRIKFFNYAVTLLSNGFPNSWNTVTSHQFTAWAKCELCLPHVGSLISRFLGYKLQSSDSRAFAELIFRCCWYVPDSVVTHFPTLSFYKPRYLYEREQYGQAREFMRAGLQVLQERESLMYASACMLQGLIELDTNNVETALASFHVALRIREQLLDPDDAFIASSLNAISLAYTEQGDLRKAVEAGQKAIDIRLRTGSDRIGNSYSNMASTLLRLGKPDEAEQMLKRCPSLKNFTDETFLSTGNPRFSGDMMLLARIRQSQGRLDDVLRLSSKALAFRQKLLGNRLKTCDSLYQVANLLQVSGNMELAIVLLEQSVSFAKSLEEAEGYFARAKFQLGRMYAALGQTDQGKDCMKAANQARRRVTKDLALSDVDSEDEFEKLVLWMLW
ncbi:hypothetical protein BJ546DRAFT_1029279 [Cryomyces antarcticus]